VISVGTFVGASDALASDASFGPDGAKAKAHLLESARLSAGVIVRHDAHRSLSKVVFRRLRRLGRRGKAELDRVEEALCGWYSSGAK